MAKKKTQILAVDVAALSFALSLVEMIPEVIPKIIAIVVADALFSVETTKAVMSAEKMTIILMKAIGTSTIGKRLMTFQPSLHYYP